MKIEVKTKSKFKLSVVEVEKLISAYILPNFPYVEYEIQQSELSPSVYIYFKCENSTRTIRISDHKTTMPYPSLCVTKNTKKSTVVHFIRNELNCLNRKMLYDHLDNLTANLNS